MVDFNKLRAKDSKKPIDPIEIFRRLPKPLGIVDLYSSQADVLQSWFKERQEQDTVVKLHTGGGKTLVALLMAQSTLNETKESVIYLVPTTQLVEQTLEKAKSLSINAVSYEKGKPLNDDFLNARAIMVGTYNALFNGKSKFGLQGKPQPQKVAAIIVDDAHTAFSVVREAFTLTISARDDKELYQNLTGLFRQAFNDIEKIGTFDDVISGCEKNIILETPYTAWHNQLAVVRTQLTNKKDSFEWPLLRDSLHLCHALVSSESFVITPIVPLIHYFPTFINADRRIYMSATIADDSDIIRTFDVKENAIKKALKSRSLAGVSERMILIPDLMRSEEIIQNSIKAIVKWISEHKLGTIILVPSNKSAEQWSDVAQVAAGSDEVVKLVSSLQKGEIFGPIVFANRYDGIDLPHNSCRLLVMSELPLGTSSYESFRASVLNGGVSMNRMLAQRIEQAIGRGARGSGDYCVVLLTGADLAAWVSKEANSKFLTHVTKAQLQMGIEVSKEITDVKGLEHVILQSVNRDEAWVAYYAEQLAELTNENVLDELCLAQATIERKAIELWHSGYHDKAITHIETKLHQNNELDDSTRGWLLQLAARVAHHWGQADQAEDFQCRAYACNRSLLRPKTRPPYRLLTAPSQQASRIIKQFDHYDKSMRRGLLKDLEEVAAHLNEHVSANQFEAALDKLGNMLGFSSERHDKHGEGPDVLWLLSGKYGLVIEAKSRKQEKNPFTKSNHGQLLVAAEWFTKYYEGYECIKVSVHPTNKATKNASADGSYALTYEKLASLISDARAIFSALCNSQLSGEHLRAECESLLKDSPLKSESFVKNYLVPFEEYP